MSDVLLQTVSLAIVASTPLLLAVMGELVTQRSGIINLGLEGTILAAAFGAALGGAGGGIAAGLLVSILFGVMTIGLKSDQIVTGTAINLLILGITGFAYREMKMRDVISSKDFITPIAWIVVPIVLAWLLWQTTIGLRIRASGENPDAVLAAGASPATYRWTALLIEGVLAGLAGTHLALVLSNGFAENMSAGRGFIALAVVIFGRWRILGAIAGSALFGVTVALQYAMQAANAGVPFHLLLAAPYVVTLLFLCGVAGRVRAPEALGK